MKPANRRQWILDYLTTTPPRMGTTSYHVDVLNSDFVDAYLEATGASYKPCNYGAHKCSQLGQDLSTLYRQKKLDRYVCGVDGMAGMAFPRWVYSYSRRIE